MTESIEGVQAYLGGFVKDLEAELEKSRVEMEELKEKHLDEIQSLQDQLEAERKKGQWKDREIEILRLGKENLEMKIELKRQKAIIAQYTTVSSPTVPQATVIPWNQAVAKAKRLVERLKAMNLTLDELKGRITVPGPADYCITVSNCFFKVDSKNKELPQTVQQLPKSSRLFYMDISNHNRMKHEEWCQLYSTLVKEQKRQVEMGMVLVKGKEIKRFKCDKDSSF
uniref:Spindle and kinetochore-associated protein 1 n=1 Tax=Caenorhabditis tropicalis TaxID=1561998 RepID=A0A1I7V3B0_9PELO